MVAACKCSCWVSGLRGGDEEDIDGVKKAQYMA